MTPSRPAGTYRAGLSAFWDRLTPNLRGMMLMGLFACAISISHTIVRALSAEIHPFEIALFRTVLPMFVLVPMLIRQGRRTGVTWWRTTRPGLQVIRGIFGGASMMAWFYTLSLIPVGDATALSFTVVIFASVGAVVVLGEKVGIRRWTAIAIGLIGTLIILRPGAQAVSLGAVTAIASSLLWAAALLTVKILARGDSNVTIVFYSSVIFTFLTAPPALYFWTWPSGAQALMLLAIGGLTLVAQLSMTAAVRAADTTAVMPMDFTRLLWASAVGFVWFGEFPDLWTWIGGGVVFISTLYISYRESRTSRPNAGQDAA